MEKSVNEKSDAGDICNWGFLGTSGIGKKNWQAIRFCDNANLLAVASRNLEQCNRYVDRCQKQVPYETPPQAIAGYDNLIANDLIDAIYIPLPTGLRKDWVLKCAEAGKHVLCEKPCALSAADLQEMIDACAANGVQFMDGVMLMHTERLSKLRHAVDHEIGELKQMHSQLTFCSDAEFKADNIRTDAELEPYGCLGDLGWYNIRVALWAMDWEMPTAVRATTISEFQRPNSKGAVPMSLSAELFFPNQVTASFFCSFELHHQQFATFNGTEGHVEVADFVLPYSNQDLAFNICKASFEIDDCSFKMQPNSTVVTTKESGNNAIDAQETKLFRKFSAIVNSGKIDNHWPSISLRTQKVMDACFESARHGNIIKMP